MANTVRDNAARQRFELVEDGLTAFANYRRSGTDLVIPHVEAPPPLRGQGTAARLMEGVVALARANGETITPLCSYARTWFLRHPPAALRAPSGPTECLTKISQTEPILAHGDPR